jgi:hypothetical protein
VWVADDVAGERHELRAELVAEVLLAGASPPAWRAHHRGDRRPAAHVDVEFELGALGAAAARAEGELGG